MTKFTLYYMFHLKLNSSFSTSRSPNLTKLIKTGKLAIYTKLIMIVSFRLSRSFWLRFKAKHSSLTIKRQGKVSVNCAMNCTVEMACDHIGNVVIYFKDLIFAKITFRKFYLSISDPGNLVPTKIKSIELLCESSCSQHF